MGWKCLTKEGVRDKRVQILGARFGDSQWSCACKIITPKSSKKAIPTDRRLWPAGRRWSKKNVPGAPDDRMVNPAPIQEPPEDPFDPWEEAAKG